MTVVYLVTAFFIGWFASTWTSNWHDASLANDLIEHGYMTEEQMEKFFTYRNR